MGHTALCLEPLKGGGELHSGGNKWADTDLVPRHIDGISLALAKTGGGPVRGLQVGPEATLLIAVDGKIEHTGDREKEIGGLRSQCTKHSQNTATTAVQPLIHFLIFPIKSLIQSHSFFHVYLFHHSFISSLTGTPPSANTAAPSMPNQVFLRDPESEWIYLSP